MSDRMEMQNLLPLMREFGSLERKRLGEGITPAEYQRWRALKSEIGSNIEKTPKPKPGPPPGTYTRRRAERRQTRLLVTFESRDELIGAIVMNISPAGLFLSTPFTAEVGTSLLVRLSLKSSAESVEIPCTVVTSFSEGAHTLASTELGMGLKFEKLSQAQAAAVSEIFEGALDDKVTVGV